MYIHVFYVFYSMLLIRFCISLYGPFYYFKHISPKPPNIAPKPPRYVAKTSQTRAKNKLSRFQQKLGFIN